MAKSTCPFSIGSTEKAPIQSPTFDLDNPAAKQKMRNEMARITDAQKKIYQETFPKIYQNAKRHGLVLFARYFSDHPHYKNIWPQFRSQQDSALIASNELANHASVYMNGLKEIVEVMDDVEKLTYFMARIARSHVKWNINKYHITNMIPGLDDVLKCCCGPEVDPEITEAWHLMYDVIGNLLDIQKKLVVRRIF